MTESRRWVLDSNLLLSRLLAPGGTAARAVDRALSSGVLLVSDATLTELADVLGRSRFDPYVSRADRQQFLRLLGGVSRRVHITRRFQACRDAKDDKFLDVAINGEADAIVSGDNDLLALHPFLGVPILTPAEFLAL
jgi:putative PIN family toxin of toxin-antitoxin system